MYGSAGTSTSNGGSSTGHKDGLVVINTNPFLLRVTVSK